MGISLAGIPPLPSASNRNYAIDCKKEMLTLLAMGSIGQFKIEEKSP